MALMAWNSTLSVNIVQFDEQHMELVNMVNELYDAMKAGNGQAVLGRIIDELISYTSTHFNDEEQHMTTHSYPEIAEHRSEHERLVKQVIELQQQFSSGQAVLTLDVMMFLKDWLMKHIQGDDKKYGAYLNEIGVS